MCGENCEKGGQGGAQDWTLHGEEWALFLSIRELRKGLGRGKGKVRMWFLKDHCLLLSSAKTVAEIHTGVEVALEEGGW